MHLPPLHARGLAQAGLTAALLLLGLSGARAQETIRILTPPASSQPVSTVAEGEVPPAPAAPAPSADCQPAAAAWIWSKVPPIPTLARPGAFIIPPTGPGYYSLKDVLQDNYRETPPKNPYPPVSPLIYSFYDADYRFLDNPDNTQFDLFDPLKRIHFCDNWLLSVGGEERVRYMHEEGGYLRLTGKDNDYSLIRSRVYGDLWYKDIFRVYAEFIDAQITGEDLAPQAIDVNHSDLLNLFADAKIFELNDRPAYVRVGRQEMYYGSQRLISPLDWANTRRTFQGVKAFWNGENLDVNAFWVQPVIINPTHFDSPDDGQQFAGACTTYRPAKGQAIDLYYLYLENTRPNFVGQFGQKAGFRVNTIGSRYAGDYEHFLWDFEGMYQFGHFSNQETSAGAFTSGIGYQFACLPMNPQLWIYNDWASGDHKGGLSSEHGTFNQLFPFGHYYFGFLDLVGRENIDDLNLQLAIYPTKWIVTTFQYHVFRLDAARDALYNAGGAAIRKDPTGRAGTDVGDEIDLTTNFHLSQHQDIFVGFSKLYAGNFIKKTGGPPFSPELFYVQYCFKW